MDHYSLEGDFRNWNAPEWELISEADGTGLLTVKLQAVAGGAPEPFSLEFLFPRRGAVGRWSPVADQSVKYLAPDWNGAFETGLVSCQPTVCFFSGNGANCAAFALSEVRRRLKITAGVRGDGMLRCRIDFFTQPEAPLEEYCVAMRIDRRELPFHQVLREMAEWYAAQPEFHSPAPPEAAQEPVFSSWYAYQQEIFDRRLEAECVLARAAGMTTLIIDDGWQTDRGGGGYAYCGDWQVAIRRFPEMKRHVEQVHALGMRCLLWYSVPFIGCNSENFQRFRGRYLYCREDLRAWVLDPRFPEVREFLVETYARALREWGLDGFKLDFIDCFDCADKADVVMDTAAGRDCESVPSAVERLLSEITEELRSLRPDVLLEFRQPYWGPAMRRYGNMFRAGDCPHDLISNRLRTVDMRLCCGSAPVHSDMICWSREDTPEQAAAQLLHVLFSVPQISVKLTELPENHRRTLAFWLQFWMENRNTLLHGAFQPEGPQWNYPLISAEDSRCRISVVYASGQTVPVELAAGQRFHLINATEDSRVAVAWSGSSRQGECFNATGEAFGRIVLRPGLQVIPLPVSGMLSLAACRT